MFALRAAPLTVGANNTISAYSTASAYWRCCQALVKSALISQRMDALSLGQLTICRLGFSDLVHRLDPGVHKLFDYPFDSIPFGSIPSASRPSVALPVHRNESVRSSSKAKQSKAKQPITCPLLSVADSFHRRTSRLQQCICLLAPGCAEHCHSGALLQFG